VRIVIAVNQILDKTPPLGEYKLKMSLLGPEEGFKSSFRNRISTGSLSNHNKGIIGVTLSGLKIEPARLPPPPAANISVSVWDIDCSARFAIFRVQYYRGSETIIVLLDENTMDQAELYCTEILQYNPSISIALVVLYEGENFTDASNTFHESKFKRFERIYIKQPQEMIDWALEKFYQKLKKNLRQDNFAIFFLPKNVLLGLTPSIPKYQDYTCPVEQFDDLNPQRRLNFDHLEKLVTKLGFPVRGEITTITNKHGEFRVSLREGNTQFTPRKCLFCRQKCHQQESICIVASSKGFSSNPEIAQAELLVVSKILALQDGDLPDHVLKQIIRLNKCPVRSNS
jgi:GTPase SAR1 family protein